MLKSWLPSVATEPAGSRLVTLAASALLAMATGNFFPPAPAWRWPLLALALAAGGCGLRPAVGRRGWWLACGVLLGLAACAAAPRVPTGPAGKPLPVRFEGSIRDGWTSGTRGWGNRLKLRLLDHAGKSVRGPGELEISVTSSVGLAKLPAPGSAWQGSGELVGDPTLPLKAPHLRVKSLLLLRPSSRESVVDRLRESGVQALRSAAGVDPVRLRAAGLAAAVVLGRREAVLEGEMASLRRSGLAHLLAVAGLHVGAFGLLVWGALRLAGVRLASRRWLLALALLGFALLAGGNAPVRRAAAAGIAYLVARQLGRPLLALPTVWGVVAGLAAFDPAALLQPGFQLTAAVTLALVRWVESLAVWLAPLPHRLAQGVAVALIAQGASSVIVGEHFVAVPPLGVAANLAAAPLALLLVAGSLLAVLVAPLWAGLAAWALQGVAASQWLVDTVSALGGTWSLPFPPLPVALALAFVAMGIVALSRARLAAAAAWCVVVAACTWLLFPGYSRDYRYEARLLGVGEGMALLLRSGESTALVDTGRSALEAWRELARARVRNLDTLVITHPDADHTGGGAALLERFRVGCLIYPQALAERGEIVPLRRLARLRGVPELPVVRGQRVALGGIVCDVLWPPPVMEGIDNDASLVARLRVGDIRLLVTGDLEARGEAEVLATLSPLRAELLQLPHHGSRTSSTPAFLAAVHPLIGLAATGVRPRFLYPDPVVAARVRRLPAVLVEQGSDTAWVGWNDGTMLAVGRGSPVVFVGRRRSVGRD